MNPITRPLSRKLFQELARRAKGSEPNRQAAEFISKHAVSKSKLASARQILATPERTPEELSEMTIDERVRNFMTLLGEPLTKEQYEEQRTLMKQYEKLSREELLQKYKAILGDAFEEDIAPA